MVFYLHPYCLNSSSKAFQSSLILLSKFDFTLRATPQDADLEFYNQLS